MPPRDYTNYTYILLQISKAYFWLPCFFVLLGQGLFSSVFFSILLSSIFILNRLLVIMQNQFHLSSQGSCHACLSIDPYFSYLMVLTSDTSPALLPFLWSFNGLTLVYVNSVLDRVQITLNSSRDSYSSQTFYWPLFNRLFWGPHKGKPEVTVGTSPFPSGNQSVSQCEEQWEWDCRSCKRASARHLDILSKKQVIGLLGRNMAHEKAFCCEVVTETERR